LFAQALMPEFPGSQVAPQMHLSDPARVTSDIPAVPS